MSWLSDLFKSKPTCEHDWKLQEENTYTISCPYTGSLRYKEYHKNYVCSKCLKVNHVQYTN